VSISSRYELAWISKASSDQRAGRAVIDCEIPQKEIADFLSIRTRSGKNPSTILCFICLSISSRYELAWISKALSDQRAGRAGRVGPGQAEEGVRRVNPRYNINRPHTHTHTENDTPDTHTRQEQHPKIPMRRLGVNPTRQCVAIGLILI